MTVNYDAAFSERQWLKDTSKEIANTQALTFLEERQLYAWLTEECYTGQGEIIDAGAFLGGSALSFALGLHRNQTIPEKQKSGRIHSFDTFKWQPWINKRFLPQGVRFGTSFLDHYHNAVKRYERMITIYPGDISTRTWSGGAIEILFIDCAKSLDANEATVVLFFEHLFPGSIVIQQDYALVSRLIWLHATMEFLWDKFAYRGTTKFGGSTVFELVEPISCEDVKACIEAVRSDSLALSLVAAERYGPDNRLHNSIKASAAAYIESKK